MNSAAAVVAKTADKPLVIDARKMSKPKRHEFEIKFFEAILRRIPRDASVMEILGGLYTKEGRIDEGLKMDRRLVRLQPDNATAHYNLACSLALIGESEEAIDELRAAFERGYADLGHLEIDTDLDSVRDLPAFLSLLEEYGLDD